MDDSRIRSKTAPFSFENGSVWTGPKSYIVCVNDCLPNSVIISYVNSLLSVLEDIGLKFLFY